MSDQNPQQVPPGWQPPPSDWGQLPPEWTQDPATLPPPPPPAGQQPYTPYNPYNPYYAPTAQRTEPLAIAALAVSLFGIVCFGMISGVVGICLGVAAQRRIDRDPSLKGRGLATAGIVVGVCVAALSLLGLYAIAKRGGI
jgi:hypothetical protein